MPRGVGDDQQVVRVAGVCAEQLAQYWHCGLEATLTASLGEPVGVEPVRRATSRRLGLDARAL